MTFPGVHRKEKEGSISCPADGESYWRPLVILRTSLPLLWPPWVATHPLVSEQLSNKTKQSVHRHQQKEHTHLWREHKAARQKGTGSGTAHAPETLHSTVRLRTSETGNPVCSPNTATLSFLSHKRVVGGGGGSICYRTKIFSPHIVPLFKKFKIHRKCYYNNLRNIPMG